MRGDHGAGESVTDGLDIEGARHIRIDAGEVKLHAVEAGRGPLVILLHGFPEFWWSWRLQIPALAAAGFHVVAPDLRGYNLSDRPPDVADYAMPHLAADVAGIVRAMGEKRAHVVGHDWGGVVAWGFAMAYPEMLDRLAILNVPHPVSMEKALLSSPRQIAKSWYIFMFQLPRLPERFLRGDDYRNLRRSLRAGRDRKVPESEIQPYVDAARRAEGLRGGIDYYRAAIRSVVTRTQPAPRVIEAPVLVIWGKKDRFLGAELAAPPERWVKNARVEYLTDASHWVQLDEPERVNALLAGFLR
jgi:pimeloyl-ACP methyl ester carboxylesterase